MKKLLSAVLAICVFMCASAVFADGNDSGKSVEDGCKMSVPFTVIEIGNDKSLSEIVDAIKGTDDSAPVVEALSETETDETIQETAEFDIAFENEASLITIHGQVKAFNEKYPLSVTAYKDGSEADTYEGIVTVTKIEPDFGRITYDYEIVVPENGLYKIVIEKPQHITRFDEIYVTYDTDCFEVPGDKYPDETMYATLFAGDADGDGEITVDDKTLFLNVITKRVFGNDLTERCDLDGDGKVDMRDYCIYKLYSNFAFENYFPKVVTDN